MFQWIMEVIEFSYLHGWGFNKEGWELPRTHQLIIWSSCHREQPASTLPRPVILWLYFGINNNNLFVYNAFECIRCFCGNAFSFNSYSNRGDWIGRHCQSTAKEGPQAQRRPVSHSRSFTQHRAQARPFWFWDLWSYFPQAIAFLAAECQTFRNMYLLLRAGPVHFILQAQASSLAMAEWRARLWSLRLFLEFARTLVTHQPWLPRCQAGAW